MPTPCTHRLILGPALVAASLATATSARAGTVKKVNEDQDEILVELTQAELAEIVEGEELLIEIGKERLITAGTVGKINVIKQQAVITLDEADDRIEAKQKIRFVSIFWNVATSPIMTSPAQYHQFARSFGETFAGGFGGTLTSTRGGSEATATTTGYRAGAQLHLILYPRKLGIGFGLERRDATRELKIETTSEEGTVESKAKLQATSTALKPEMWYEFAQGWLLGLRYHYDTIDHSSEEGPVKLTWNYTIGQVVMALTSFDERSEWGVEYRDKARFETADALRNEDGTQDSVQNVYKVPAEMSGYYRRATSPVFVWGVGATYRVFDRRYVLDAPMERAPGIDELISMRATFEHRLDSGNKLEWMLYYDGAKTIGLSTLAKNVNAAGISVGYHRPVSTGWIVGGTFAAEGGSLKAADDRVVEEGSAPLTEENTGFEGSLLAFVRRDFEFTDKKIR